MTSKPFCLGIDPGQRGAIAIIDQYRKNVTTISPRLIPWEEPQDEDPFYSIGKKKGKRKWSVPKRGWGAEIIDTPSLWAALPTYELGGLLSYLEDPGTTKGKTGQNFRANYTVGGNMFLMANVVREATGNLPCTVTPKQWQDHPLIDTYGKVDHNHGAIGKNAKKHAAITAANEFFGLHLSYGVGDTEGKQAASMQDGEADACLIGLYGALKYPVVARLSVYEAWFILNGEQALTVPIDSDLPFTEILIYAAAYSKSKDPVIAKTLAEAYGVTFPQHQRIPQGKIIGKVTTDGVVLSKGKSWTLPEQRIIARKVFSDPITVDGGMTRTVRPFLDKIP